MCHPCSQVMPPPSSQLLKGEEEEEEEEEEEVEVEGRWEGVVVETGTTLSGGKGS